MNIPKLSISNYQFTLMAFIALLAVGLSSFLSMPQREDPALDIPNMIAVAVYPGANPKDIESQVVDPLEEVINEIEDLKELQTTIRDGVAIMEIEFDFGVDTDEKFDEVQRQINGVSGDLPPDLFDLSVRQINTNTVSIFQLALTGEGIPYNRLYDEAELVKNVIEEVDGVRKVQIEAYPEEEVRVALNPVKMTEMGVSLEDINQAIQANNANIPGGAIKMSDKLFNLKTSGSYQDLEEISNTVVGSYQGKLIYLKDIAAVYFDYEEERWLARYRGQKSIYVTVQQKEGYNIFSISEPIKERLDQLSLREGISLHYVFDQSSGVRTRVNGFLVNLLQGIGLVGIIIFLLLGWRSATIVMLAIPLSILIGLSGVDQMGYALQQISIAGLVVALGLLVDNSIAIIENIERYLSLGYSRKDAAIQGAQQLIAPITSATVTTVLAFVPIVLMPDTTGAFIRALPITVIATLTASLLVAITLTPYLASRLLRERDTGPNSGTRAFRGMRNFVEGPYRRSLALAFRYKWWLIGIALAMLMGALSLFPLVGVSFFPKAEKPQFRITVTLPNGSNIEATDRAVGYVESVLDTTEQVAYYASNTGHGNPRIYYNVASTSYSNTFGEIFVVLKEYEVDAFYALLDELRITFADYPYARIDVREYVQGPPSEAPIAIKIFGEDLAKLQKYARQVEEVVRNAPGAINVDNPIRSNSTDLVVQINRDKAMLFGVPVVAIDQSVRTFVNGAPVGTFRDPEGEDFNIVMRYNYQDKFRMEHFQQISVPSATGAFIPLLQLADISFEEAPSRITHLDMDRTATILADLDQGYTLDEVIAEVDKGMQRIEWENGYEFVYKGDLENRNESFGGMGIASIAALFFILGVLVIQFRSFSQPLIIFSALPLAIIGSILALFITGIAFSFTAFVGLTSLIGIAINNSIVLVDFANERVREGASVREAAREAGEVRFVPIVMTTLTTILGLLPLTLAGGSLWAPMGWTIIGGLLTSTTFVLLLVPVLYQLFTRDK